MSYPSPTPNDESKRLRKDLNELTNLTRFQFMPAIQAESMLASASSIKSVGSNSMVSLWSILPAPHRLTNEDPAGATHAAYDRINLVSSSVIVYPKNDLDFTPTLELKTIYGTKNNGQIILIKPVVDILHKRTLVLKTGDNINITSDLVIEDNQFAILQYQEENGNKYNVLMSGSSGSGGNEVRQMCKVATTTNNGTHPILNATAIDGITLAVNDRVLVKNQTTQKDNGIYYVSTIIGPVVTLARATDMADSSIISGNILVSVDQGTTNKDTAWIFENSSSKTVGTDAITFTLWYSVSSTADNLGNHTATTDLKLENYKIYFNTGLTKYIQNSDSLGINYVTPNSTSHWFHIGGSGSYTFGIADGGVSTQIPILMNNNYLEGVDYIDFDSSGSLQKIDTSADGKVFNFYTNGNIRMNVSEDSNVSGVLEMFGNGPTQMSNVYPSAVKVVSKTTGLGNNTQTIGALTYDMPTYSTATQKSFAIIYGQATNSTNNYEKGKLNFAVLDNSGTFFYPKTILSLDGTGASVTGNLSITGTFNPNNIDMTNHYIKNIDYLTFVNNSQTDDPYKILLNDAGNTLNFQGYGYNVMNLTLGYAYEGVLELRGYATPLYYRTPAMIKTVYTEIPDLFKEVGSFHFDGKNNLGTQITYAQINGLTGSSVTNGSEKGELSIYLRNGSGNISEVMNISLDTGFNLIGNVGITGNLSVGGTLSLTNIDMNNHYIKNIDYLTFANNAQTDDPYKILLNDAGNTLNFQAYGYNTMNLTLGYSYEGVLELRGYGAPLYYRAPAMVKTVSTYSSHATFDNIGSLHFDAKNNLGTQITYAQINGLIGSNRTSGTEKGELSIYLRDGAGDISERINVSMDTGVTVVGNLSVTGTISQNAISASSLTLTDSGLNPTTNGEIRRNGSDVKVYSNNIVRNLSAPIFDSANITGNTVLGANTNNTLTINAALNSSIRPITTNTYDLGTSSFRWRNTYLINLDVSGTITLPTSTVNVTGDLIPNLVSSSPWYDLGSATNRWSTVYASALDVTTFNPTNLSVSGNTTLGNASVDTVTINGSVNASVIPTGTVNLGSTTARWANVYAGAINANGNTTLGDASTDTVTFNASVNSNVLPTGTINLGASGSRWSTVYATTVDTTNLTVTTFSPTNLTVSGTLTVSGSQKITNIVSGASGRNLSSTDYIFYGTGTSASQSVVLPSASTNAGKIYIIYQKGSGGTLTVSRTSPDLIDGVTSKSLTFGQGMMVVSDGVDTWMTVGAV